MAYDVVTLGEALLRLTPPDFRRLDQSPLLEMHIGGSELNTAVGLARLGLCVAWVSRLTDNVVGHHIVRTLRAQGVMTDHVIWTDTDRVGLYYVEEAKAPRTNQVTYDRAGSSMSRIQPEDIDLAALNPSSCRLLHMTGITLALSASCIQTVQYLVTAFQTCGIPLSFDLNYRMRLWDMDTARQVCEPFLQAASILFIPARDAVTFYGTDDLERLHARYPQATIVMTRGAQGASAITPEGSTFSRPAYPAETVSRIGGGDAFAAGFLYAYLQSQDIPTALAYGNAVAALKYSLPGDMPLVDRSRVLQIIAETDSGSIIR